MTEQELIARQALQLEELRDRVADLESRVKKAMLQMVGIGGPLNDSRLTYSKEQLAPFYRIRDALAAALADGGE